MTERVELEVMKRLDKAVRKQRPQLCLNGNQLLHHGNKPSRSSKPTSVQFGHSSLWLFAISKIASFTQTVHKGYFESPFSRLLQEVDTALWAYHSIKSRLYVEYSHHSYHHVEYKRITRNTISTNLNFLCFIENKIIFKQLSNVKNIIIFK